MIFNYGGNTQHAIELLWQNPNPTNSYSSGAVIQLYPNDYSMLFLTFFTYTSNSIMSTAPLTTNASGRLQVVCATNNNATFKRFVYVNDSNITFGDGSRENGTEVEMDGKYGIPYRIYGVR